MKYYTNIFVFTLEIEVRYCLQAKDRNKAVLIINEHESDNLGDQIIGMCMVHLINQNNLIPVAVDFTRKDIFSKSPVRDKTSLRPTSKVKKLIRILIPAKLRWLVLNHTRVRKICDKDYGFAFIGGGQLILDNPTFPIAFFIWSYFLNTKPIVFAVGCGTKYSGISKKLIKSALSNSKRVFLRDEKSVAILKNQFGKSSEFVPDVGFLLSDIIEKKSLKKNCILVGVVDRSVKERYSETKIEPNSYFESWRDTIESSVECWSDVKLFSTTDADYWESLAFQKFMKSEHGIEVECLITHSVKSLVDQVQRSSLVISGRMHALIVAMTYGVEFTPFLVSPKIEQFAAEYSGQDSKSLKSRVYQTFKNAIS